MSQNNTNWSSWNSSLLAPRSVCVALVMSCGIYAGLMISGLLGVSPTEPGLLAYIFPVIGLSMLPVSVIVSRLLWTQKVSSEIKEVDGVFATEKVLADPADARKQYLSAALAPFLVRAAMNETAAVFGLVGFLVGGTPLPIAVGLCGIAALATAVMFPRSADWKVRAETKLGARFPEE